MALQVKVREHGLQPRLTDGPVCDDSAAEGSICANAVLYKSVVPLPMCLLSPSSVICCQIEGGDSVQLGRPLQTWWKLIAAC